SEKVAGKLSLRIEPLRLLHELDAVDAEGRHPGRLRFVGAALDPDEPAVLLRDAPEHVRAILAQGAGDRGRDGLPLLARRERARVGEDRVHVLGDGERRALAIGDLSPAGSPFDLPPGLLTGEAREPGPV